MLPQGSFENQARGKSHVRIAVFTILAVHVVVLGALLIQGCKRDDTPMEDEAMLETNELGMADAFSNVVPDPVVTPAEPPPAVTSTAPGIATTPTPTTPNGNTPPPADGGFPVTPAPAETTLTAPTLTEHTIVRGDTLSDLAKQYGVSLRAIQEANPGVDPTRLQIGQKIVIPSRPAATETVRNGETTATAPPASDSYTVKSGDTLSAIARRNGTTVREIQRLNNLVTTQIRVGQKLKLPPRSTPSPANGTPLP